MMISLEIIQIATLLSVAIILITFFYLIWRKPAKASGKIILSLILLFAIADFIYFVGTHDLNHYRFTAYRTCVRNLSKELNFNRDDKALLAALSDWLENENGTVGDLNPVLFNLQPSGSAEHEYNSGDAIKYPVDEYSPYARPVPHQLPPKGNSVDYSKIPGFAARVKIEQKQNDAYWKGNSVIVSGKIRLSGSMLPEGIAAHTSFLRDGVFAKCVYPGKSLNFVKSGYEPIFIYIAPDKKYPGQYLDMGELVMQKLPPEQQKQISFTLSGPQTADVYLVTGWQPGVFADDGHECAAPVRVSVENCKARRGEKMTFSGLSPIAYELILSAPGCVAKTKYFTIKKDNIDFGVIHLMPSRKFTFRQRPFSAMKNTSWEEATLEINGRNELVIAPKDELGNTVALSLTPDIRSDKILAGFSWSIPEWYDYGEISQKALDGKLPEPKKSLRDKFLQQGHLYRFISDMKKVDQFIYLSETSSKSKNE